MLLAFSLGSGSAIPLMGSFCTSGSQASFGVIVNIRRCVDPSLRRLLHFWERFTEKVSKKDDGKHHDPSCLVSLFLVTIPWFCFAFSECMKLTYSFPTLSLFLHLRPDDSGAETMDVGAFIQTSVRQRHQNILQSPPDAHDVVTARSQYKVPQ